MINNTYNAIFLAVLFSVWIGMLHAVMTMGVVP